MFNTVRDRIDCLGMSRLTLSLMPTSHLQFLVLITSKARPVLA